MHKRSVLVFYRRHRLLLAFLSGVIIQLPQYIDALWSLSEHVSGGARPVSMSWLYWVTVPLGLGVIGSVVWLTRRPILSEPEKAKVVELMTSVNALDDKMSRYFNASLRHEKDRVTKYRDLLDSLDFNQLWDKCSKQRADISTVSPELGEQVRLLLLILQTSYGFMLKDWFVHEQPKIENAIERHVKATEAIRRRIRNTVEKLMW